MAHIQPHTIKIKRESEMGRKAKLLINFEEAKEKNTKKMPKSEVK